MRAAVSVAGLAGFEVTGAARAAWSLAGDAAVAAGLPCGVATVVRPARRRHPGAWLAGLLISECFASDCGEAGQGRVPGVEGGTRPVPLRVRVLR